jgi:hypothetical protein
MLSSRFGFDERHRAFPIHLSYFTAASMAVLLQRAGWNVDRMFTAGLGIDELRNRPPSRSAQSNRSWEGRSTPSVATSPLRSAIKRLVHSRRWGENLCVFAKPQ